LSASAATDSKGLILGNRDEPLSGLGNVQASKVAEFLLDMKVGDGFRASSKEKGKGVP
jgi:hypothetical protein